MLHEGRTEGVGTRGIVGSGGRVGIKYVGVGIFVGVGIGVCVKGEKVGRIVVNRVGTRIFVGVGMKVGVINVSLLDCDRKKDES